MGTLLNQASAAQTTGGVSAPLITEAFTSIAVDVNVSAVSGSGSPTLDLFVERLGADENWYAVWSPSGVTGIGVSSTSIGPGCTIGAVLTGTLRFRWAITGSTPSFTFSASIVGRS